MFKTGDSIVNLTTGAKPDTETAQQIVSAHDIGAKRAQEFIDERLRSRLKPLDATISRQKVPSFDQCCSKQVTQKDYKRIKRIPLTKLLIMGQARELDIKTSWNMKHLPFHWPCSTRRVK